MTNGNLGPVGPAPNQAPANPGFLYEHRKGFGVATAVAILAVGSLGVKSCAFDADPASESTPTTEQTTTSTTIDQDRLNRIEELFNVDTVSADCEVIVNTAGTAEYDDSFDRVAPEVGALKPVSEAGGQENRLWSDAMSNELTTGPEKEALETELKASLCEDPLLAVTVANFFANMEVDGVNIGELNQEWLGEYTGGQETINDKAAAFMPLMDHEGDVTTEDATAALEASQKHEDLAERLATMLDRLMNEGVHVEATALNYHLAAAGMAVGTLPEVELNGNQYTGEMLVFVGEAKDGECLVRIGFNVKDQRPVITTEVCKPETPDTTQPPVDTTEPPTTQPPTSQPPTTRPPTTQPPTTRPENTPSAPPVIQGPGAGGNPDEDNNPDNNATTIPPTTAPPTTGPPPTVAVTSTTLGECGAACE